MYYQDLIPDALELVSAWDIPNEDFARTVNDQAKLMSGMPPEEILEGYPETL
jgi:hypothetical protein